MLNAFRVRTVVNQTDSNNPFVTTKKKKNELRKENNLLQTYTPISNTVVRIPLLCECTAQCGNWCYAHHSENISFHFGKKVSRPLRAGITDLNVHKTKEHWPIFLAGLFYLFS